MKDLLKQISEEDLISLIKNNTYIGDKAPAQFFQVTNKVEKIYT